MFSVRKGSLRRIMTDVSGAAFANQLMYFRNPSINTYDSSEFTDPQNAEYAPVSHQVAAESYIVPSKRKKNILGFKYDNDQSDLRHAVYVHNGKTQAEKRVVLGYRGTDSSNARDLYTDSALTQGKFNSTKHYKEGRDQLHSVIDSYPDHTVHLTGHSLGAHSQMVHHRENLDNVASSIGFNTPGSIHGVLSDVTRRFYKTKAQKKYDKNSTHFINRYDPVSLLLRGRSGSRMNTKWSTNPHSLSQWKNY